MDKSELLKDLKKVGLNLIKKSDIKMFQAEKMAVEYYNDAVDNIVEGNTDIAVIKLKKVLSLSPDFSEAAQLLDKLSEYEKSHSIGDKVYESMHGRDVHARATLPGKKTLPQKLHINPRVLLKIILVILAIAVTVVISVVVFKLFDKEPGPVDNTEKEITYSQSEVDSLNETIDELEESLAKSENEIQDAVTKSAEKEEALSQVEKERDDLKAQLDLYKAAVFLEQEKYQLSADIARSLNAENYSGDEKALYDSVYNQATFQAADSLYKTGLNLYSQKDYEGAIENLEKVDDYAPDFENLGNCYFKLGVAYYQLDRADKSLELFEYIEMNIPGYDDQTGLIYYTGKAYQKLGQFDKAREMYNIVINEYPDSSYVGYAKDRLKEMD